MKTLRVSVSPMPVTPSHRSQDTYIAELFGVELGLQEHRSVGDRCEFGLVRVHFVSVLEEKRAYIAHCTFLFLSIPHQDGGTLHAKRCFL